MVGMDLVEDREAATELEGQEEVELAPAKLEGMPYQQTHPQEQSEGMVVLELGVTVAGVAELPRVGMALEIIFWGLAETGAAMGVPVMP